MENCINLKEISPIEPEKQPESPKLPKALKKKGKLWKKLLVIGIFLLVCAGLFLDRLAASSQPNEKKTWYSKLPIVGNIQQIVVGADKKLKGEENDRINILLLGVGGKDHDGGTLTDTIMMVSLQPSTKKAAMVSVPRDLTVPIENMGWRKINAVNAYAEKANPGSGGLAISQTINDILDVPVDYYLRVDFQGFTNIINELGGIDVYVDNQLDDYAYPVLGREDAYPYSSRYEHLHVETGWQKMDGETALKFARSRHGVNGEGSDFARAKRQQKIIQATKDKLMTGSILFKPALITKIINELQDHISTNLKIWEIIKLWDMFKNTKQDDVVNKVLDNGPGGFLVSSISSEGAYILSPRSGDFTEIQYMVSTLFGTSTKETTVDKEEVTAENSTVEIYNGTWINGLASRISTDLEKDGFKVTRIGNSSRKDFQKSVIYDLTRGNKMASVTALKEKINANISLDMPEWLKLDLEKIKTEGASEQPDFILILGQTADHTSSGAENINQ